MTVEETLERISLNEDSTVEFKQVTYNNGKLYAPKQDLIADEIAAFANSSIGGTIYFGVADDKSILGIPDEILPQLEKTIRSACVDSINPPLYSIISTHQKLPDITGELKNILELKISSSIYVHQSPGGYYKRVCDAKVQIQPEELARLFMLRSQAKMRSYDETPIQDSSEANLNKELLDNYFDQYFSPSTDNLLKAKILSKLENKICCSIGGILLFGDNPQEFLSSAAIECVKYSGLIADSNYQVDANRIEGNLFHQIDEAYHFVLKNSFTKAEKKPHRIETKQFSERAVFEAISNAIAHRDYSIYGSKIRLFMFDDRLELRVPGRLPNSMTVESLSLRQFTRNELIVRFLGRTSTKDSSISNKRKYMEARGEGVPLIIRESAKLSGQKPEYKLNSEEELMLTIWGAK